MVDETTTAAGGSDGSDGKPKRLAKAPKPRPLTERQRRFVEAYAASGNGTHAARIAGFAGDDHVLAIAGSRLLANAKVASAIAEHARKHTRANVAAREERLELLTSIARGQISAPIGISGGKVVYGPPTAGERRRAAMDLARMNGELIDKAPVEVNVNARSVHVVLMVPPSPHGPAPSAPPAIEATSADDAKDGGANGSR